MYLCPVLSRSVIYVFPGRIHVIQPALGGLALKLHPQAQVFLKQEMLNTAKSLLSFPSQSCLLLADILNAPGQLGRIMIFSSPLTPFQEIWVLECLLSCPCCFMYMMKGEAIYFTKKNFLLLACKHAHFCKEFRKS